MSESSRMIHTVAEILWLFLPAAIANTAPVFAAKYKWLESFNIPIDGEGAVLGQNKTLRGFIVGIIFGSISGYIQYLFSGHDIIQSISLVSYADPASSIVLGGTLGLGALLGDSVKSFFKRKLNIPSGKPWRPWDQVDYVIGALVTSSLFVSLSLQQIILSIIIFGTLSWVTSVTGYNFKIKKSI